MLHCDQIVIEINDVIYDIVKVYINTYNFSR